MIIEKYIARDKDGRLFIYNLTPCERFEDSECFIPQEISPGYDDRGYFQLPRESFPEITWDNSPIKITFEI